MIHQSLLYGVYFDFQKCHNCAEIDKYTDKRVLSWMFYNIIPNAGILQKYQVTHYDIKV